MLRELSLAGRIQVFKALALSKAMFICTMKPYSKKFLDDLNEIQKDFIWRGRKPKIKHTSLIADHSEGGMKDIDIKGKLESLRIQWVISLTNNNFHSWKIIPNFLLKDVGGVSLFHSNLALSVPWIRVAVEKPTAGPGGAEGATLVTVDQPFRHRTNQNQHPESGCWMSLVHI